MNVYQDAQRKKNVWASDHENYLFSRTLPTDEQQRMNTAIENLNVHMGAIELESDSHLLTRRQEKTTLDKQQKSTTNDKYTTGATPNDQYI